MHRLYLPFVILLFGCTSVTVTRNQDVTAKIQDFFSKKEHYMASKTLQNFRPAMDALHSLGKYQGDITRQDLDAIAEFLLLAYEENPAEVSLFNCKYPRFVAYSNIHDLPVIYERRVDIHRFIHPEKGTIFYFTASWCKSCREIRPYVEKAAREHDMVIRQVDIVDWGTPADDVLRYYCRKSGNCHHSLPYLVIFDKENIIYNGIAFEYIRKR